MAVLLQAGSLASGAQEDKVPQTEPDHPYTLHVYTNLIQIPSLVLTPSRSSYRGLTADDFILRLDSGPPFHPVHSRLEGNDPVTLSLLLDRSSGTDTSLVDKLDRALDHLPPDVMRPQDSVTIYTLNCSLVRSVYEPSSVESLRNEVGRVLHPAEPHSRTDSAKCRKRLQLWDAISAVASQLQSRSGRRVILAITDGTDAGGENSWPRLRQYASDHSIAIFSIAPESSVSTRPISNGRVAPIQESHPETVELQMLCEGTGGLLLNGNAGNVGSQIQKVLGLLRARYILEFPRATGSEAGLHQIDVAVTDRHAIIHTSGIAVPVEDKTLLADPTTVPTDTSHLPVMGAGHEKKSPE